jgi:type II secretory pathway component HofQ
VAKISLKLNQYKRIIERALIMHCFPEVNGRYGGAICLFSLLLLLSFTEATAKENNSSEQGLSPKVTELSPEALRLKKSYTGRKVSLDFKEADIQDVLRTLAEVGGVNIVAGDDVKGKITIRLIDVPWDQALDIILLTMGLGKVQLFDP